MIMMIMILKIVKLGISIESGARNFGKRVFTEKRLFERPLLSLKYYIALLSNNFNYTPLAKGLLIILIIYLEHYL